MAEFTFTLKLDNDVIAGQSKDNFCIAKKVAGKFTTVFQDAAIVPNRVGQKPLFAVNTFKWTDKYKVFAAVEYKAGILVQSATNVIDLQFGQFSAFNKGQFQSPLQASPDDFPGGDQTATNSFISKTVPTNLHAAVQCLAGGAWVSIYVDDETHNAPMNKVLTPQNQYALFWNSVTRTESMIDNSTSSQQFTFQFPADSTSKTVRFGYATENKGTPGEQFKFYDV